MNNTYIYCHKCKLTFYVVNLEFKQNIPKFLIKHCPMCGELLE